MDAQMKVATFILDRGDKWFRTVTISDETEVYPQLVNYHLREFKKKGFLEQDGQRYRVAEPDEFKQFIYNLLDGSERGTVLAETIVMQTSSVIKGREIFLIMQAWQKLLDEQDRTSDVPAALIALYKAHIRTTVKGLKKELEWLQSYRPNAGTINQVIRKNGTDKIAERLDSIVNAMKVDHNKAVQSNYISKNIDLDALEKILDNFNGERAAIDFEEWLDARAEG